MVNFFGGLVVGSLDSWDPPCERDCYLGVPLESQTTNPNHQLTIILLMEEMYKTL